MCKYVLILFSERIQHYFEGYLPKVIYLNMKYTAHLYQLLNRHKSAFAFSLVVATGLIIISIMENQFDKTFLYLVVMVLCFLLSEFIYFTSKPDFSEWKIKNPKKELVIIIFTILFSSLLMVYWFLIVDQERAGQTLRIITMVLRLLFIFPVFLLIYFLAVEKYKLREIGIWKFNYWFISLPIIILIGGVTYLAFPDGMQFRSALKDSGIQGLIVLGFLTAAIPEEIARNLFQSRLGAVINSNSVAWFLIALIWAMQHIPLFAFKSGNYYDATISAFAILPIGLLWGYLNQRYKSIIPSVLIHGTNLWGIQNIF